MDLAFWFGLALAVPIGIGTNLLTTVLQRRLGRRSITVRHANEQKLAEDRALAQKLYGDLGQYEGFLHQHTVRLLTFVLSIVATVNLPFYVGSFVDLASAGYLSAITYAVTTSLAIIIVTALTVAYLNVRRRSLRIIELVGELGFASDRANAHAGGPASRLARWLKSPARRRHGRDTERD